MKVCFIAGREPGYQRNRVLLKALNILGVELLQITSDASNYMLRFPSVLIKFIRSLGVKPDVYLVGFLGHPLVPILRMVTDRPIVFDPFISLYDTLCYDRRRFSPDSLAGRAIYGVDKLACEMADKVILDTEAHIKYFSETLGHSRDKYMRIFVGADDCLYYPRNGSHNNNQPLNVFYYSTFQPLHGTGVVLEAMELLHNRHDLRFTLIGKGPEYRDLKDRLHHVMQNGDSSWKPWVPEAELPEYINRADICLGGHFSTSPKASRVIPGKVYQFMAMGKPIIAGNNPANLELLRHEENALLVEMGDPEALAGAIARLADNKNLRFSIGENGKKTYLDSCTPKAISCELNALLEGTIRNS